MGKLLFSRCRKRNIEKNGKSRSKKEIRRSRVRKTPEEDKQEKRKGTSKKGRSCG